MHRITARNVRVEYSIYEAGGRSLKNTLLMSKLPLRRRQSVGGNILRSGSKGKVSILALEDVNFSVASGDRLGLIGHNGAGKSTLLKVIAGIYEPVEGSMETEGKIMPMFSLSDGMDPESTGYENVRLRCLVLGIAKDQIDTVADDVTTFSELGEYMHMPIKTYSSGMMVRLTFGIATAIRPEILVMDEMIGAGDAMFIDKAEARLKHFIDQASILVVATHHPAIVRQWCNKALLLHQGRSIAFGPVEDVIGKYDEIVHRADHAAQA